MAHVCKCKTCGHEMDEPVPASASLVWTYAELAKIVLRITQAAGSRTRLGDVQTSDTLAFAIADADDFLKPQPKEPLLTEAEEAEALSYMDGQPSEQPQA